MLGSSGVPAAVVAGVVSGVIAGAISGGLVAMVLSRRTADDDARLAEAVAAVRETQATEKSQRLSVPEMSRPARVLGKLVDLEFDAVVSDDGSAEDEALPEKTPGGHTEEDGPSFKFPHRTLDVNSEVEGGSQVRRGTNNGDSDGAVMGPNQQELMARGFRQQSESGAIQRGASALPDEESIIEESVNDTSRRGPSGGGAAEHRHLWEKYGKGSLREPRAKSPSSKSSLALAVAESARRILPNRIIMVRHGESEGNADHTLDRTKPDNLVELTKKGWQQASKAGERIREIIGSEQVHMFTSPFTRTVQTANAIKRQIPRQVVRMSIDPRIREQEFGNIQGDDFKALREEQQKVGRFYYRFPTGESGADVWDRTKQWWDALMNVNLTSSTPLDTVVVVTHGLTMRLILMQMYGWSPNTFHTVWNADNCALYVLDRDCSSDVTRMYIERPFRTPYRINDVIGDVPVSSMKVKVKMLGVDGTREMSLSNYLSLPQPRLNQFPIAALMLSEEHSIDCDQIEAITCCGNFHGEFHTTPFTVPRHRRQSSTNRHLLTADDSLGQFIARNSFTIADATTGIDGDGENTMPL